MRAIEHGEVVAGRDDVVARLLRTTEGIDHAVALLDKAEALVELPLVDESVRERLRQMSETGSMPDGHWHALVAARGDDVVGFAETVLPSASGTDAVADLAIDRQALPVRPVVATLLAGLECVAWDHQASRLVVWIRSASTSDVITATKAGFDIDRRLGVLGRGLGEVDTALPTAPDGVTIRTLVPGQDDQALVELFEAAYAGTGDAGWTVEGLRERYGWSWFDAADVLLAVEDDGHVAAVHWTKQRGDGIGEVYNLAVAPRAQGRRLGQLMLRSGLAHLAGIGCTDVLLWVDMENDRGVRLYAGDGFTFRQEDVAFARDLRGSVAPT